MLLWHDKHLLVCRRGDPQMFFVVTSIGGVAGLGWPAAVTNMGAENYYWPKAGISPEDMQWFWLVSLAACPYDAVPIEFVAGLHFHAHHALPGPSGVCCKSLPPRGLGQSRRTEGLLVVP